MDPTQLQTKLLRVARQNPPSDHVPYAFEKRIMAQLTKPVVDIWTVWSHGLLRAAATCAVVTLLIGGWAWHEESATDSAPELSQAFENTVMAALDVEEETR